VGGDARCAAHDIADHAADAALSDRLFFVATLDRGLALAEGRPQPQAGPGASLVVHVELEVQAAGLADEEDRVAVAAGRRRRVAPGWLAQVATAGSPRAAISPVPGPWTRAIGRARSEAVDARQAAVVGRLEGEGEVGDGAGVDRERVEATF
jgi:hypothetical protein